MRNTKMSKLVKSLGTVLLMLFFVVSCTKPDEPEPQTIVAQNGVVDGLFSVSENTKVFFSQGNLQHQPSTRAWRFADEQYDCLQASE